VSSALQPHVLRKQIAVGADDLAPQYRKLRRTQFVSQVSSQHGGSGTMKIELM